MRTEDPSGQEPPRGAGPTIPRETKTERKRHFQRSDLTIHGPDPLDPPFTRIRLLVTKQAHEENARSRITAATDPRTLLSLSGRYIFREFFFSPIPLLEFKLECFSNLFFFSCGNGPFSVLFFLQRFFRHTVIETQSVAQRSIAGLRKGAS